MRRVDMKMSKFVFLAGSTLLIALITPAYSSQNNQTKFFASNNTGIIDIGSAYQRLIGLPQVNLQNNMIRVLQNNHMEQGKLEDVLGAYEMATEKKVTADNSEIFYTSPQQVLTNEDVFKVGQELATALKQESVAVFIPSDQSSISDIEVNFTAQAPSINQITNLINKNLPLLYQQAFSLRLNTKGLNLFKPTVSRIEWLGSQIKLNEIRQAFPGKKLTFQRGSAYLVYKNGSIQHL